MCMGNWNLRCRPARCDLYRNVDAERLGGMSMFIIAAVRGVQIPAMMHPA